MDPVLIDVPEALETARLLLRAPRAGDGPALHGAVTASHDLLRRWMPWAEAAQSLDDAEAYCRRQRAKFILREDLVMFVFEKDSGRDPDAPLLGALGLHRIDWPNRCFEVGYWRRVGCGGLGVLTEAVSRLARMAFDQLAARRVEIRMDDDNERSWKLAERAGFTLEGVLRLHAARPDGSVRSTRVYARVRGIEE